MYGILKSIYLRAWLYVMRRNQYENLLLRHHFASRYDVSVGLYSFGCFDRWRMPGPMVVGRYCSIASTVRSVLANHPIDSLTTHPILYDTSLGFVQHSIEPPHPLVIEDDVWIGHNAVILPNCKFIGRGCIVGAGSVVTKNVDRYAIVAGNPAQKLRDRFPSELISAIEESRWWELNRAELLKAFRSMPNTFHKPSTELINSFSQRVSP